MAMWEGGREGRGVGMSTAEEEGKGLEGTD